MAGLALKKIQEESPDLEVRTVEVTSSPLVAWRAGIRMIPSIKCGGNILSGLTINQDKLRLFIEKNKT